tara:strand:+ start:67 stop:393 length:327 start_codon:yes stop_codon:yes gene_type:complete
MRSKAAHEEAFTRLEGLEMLRPWNPAERIALVQLREHVRDWIEAKDILDRDGLICEGSQGQPVPHPAQAMKVTAADRISRWFRQLGLLDEATEELDSLDSEKKKLLGL